MTYNPPQPMWKRSTAGILDFFLAFVVCVYLSSRLIAIFNVEDVIMRYNL